jgi:uncharacterized RDD family membrane protein YckC
MQENQPISFLRRRTATLVDLVLSGLLLLGVTAINAALLQKFYAHPSPELRLWMTQHQVDAFGGSSDFVERSYPAMPLELKAEFLSLSSKSTLIFWSLALLALWFYHAFLEAKATTPGKWLAGLVVRDRIGERISACRATVRLFGKLLLVMAVTLFFGTPLFLAASYLVPQEYATYSTAGIGIVLFVLISIPFTKKTATFYDGLAGCVVTRKGGYPSPASQDH